MKEHNEFLKCNKCGKTFSSVVIDEVDNDIDSNMLESLMNMKYFLYECPHCGNTSIYNHSLLLIDNKLKCEIMLSTDKKTSISFVEYADKNNDGITKYRLVSSYIEQIEKYMIFKCGLDDRIIEIYKDNIARELLNNNVKFDRISFMANTIEDYYIASTYNGEVTSYEIDLDKYNMLNENFKDFIFMKRNNDYIVNEEFIYNMKTETLECEPLHYDKLFRSHVLASIVEVDGKVELYNANILAIGKNVEVYFNGELKEGIYRDIIEISEKRLGRKLKSLANINKVYYTKDEYDYLLNNTLLDKVCNNLERFSLLGHISSSKMNNLTKGAIVKCSDLIVCPKAISENSNITILSANARVGRDETYEYASFNNDYFIVVEDNEDKKVLLHLPYEYWHLFKDINLDERVKYINNNDIIFDSKRSSYYYDVNKKPSFEVVESPLEIREEFILKS